MSDDARSLTEGLPCTMKALSLWQPWASLVALGVKTIETRSWATNYRGPLAIHAAKRPPEVGLWLGSWCVSQHRNGRAIHSYPPPRGNLGWYLLPLGSVIATCTLVDVVPMLDRRLGRALDATTVSVSDHDLLLVTPGETPVWRDIEEQRPYGDFTPGRYAWLLEDIKPTTERCPACWPDEHGTVQIDPTHRVPLDYLTPSELCSVCGKTGHCDPIPARGRQQLWEWSPAA